MNIREAKITLEHPRGFTMDRLEKKYTAIDTLRHGCKLIEDLGYKYWVSAGTLLGIHRDNQFIPHDTDIDIEIYVGPNTKINVREILQNMKAIGFDLIRIQMLDSAYPTQLAFMNVSNNVIFDVYWYYDDPFYDHRIINRTVDGILWYPKEKILELETLTFKDHDFIVPDPDWYCEFRYGVDWKTPAKEKGEWQMQATNLERT